MPIVVDPYLIAVPSAPYVDADRVRTFARSLVAWEKEFVKRPQDYVISEEAYSVIILEGLMPTMSALQDLFDRHGIDEYSARDIVPDCSGYLANPRYLEDVSGAKTAYREIEHVQGSESVIPEEMRARLTPAVADAFVGSLIYAACALEAQQITSGWSIATAPLNSADPIADLRTTATVRRFADETEDIVDTKIQRDWPLLVEPDYLYASYDVTEYTNNPFMAARITWCRLKAQGRLMESVDWGEVRFGEHFVDSLTNAKMQRRPDLTRDIEDVYFTIVSVLQGLPLGSDKHHALRDPIWMHSAPIQKRKVMTSDGAPRHDEAARVEVSGGPAPLRLHYWRCYDGTREFSNVTCDHDDPTIYDN